MTRGNKPGPPFPGTLAISLIGIVVVFIVVGFFASRPTATTERYQDQDHFNRTYQGVDKGWLDNNDRERRK